MGLSLGTIIVNMSNIFPRFSPKNFAAPMTYLIRPLCSVHPHLKQNRWQIFKNFRQHKMAIHPLTNNGQSYPCTRPGCTRVFKVAAKLRMHDDVVHKNLEGKYKCQFCPKKFWGKSSLREHTNGVHLNTKPHKCELCDFSSAYRSKYIRVYYSKIVLWYIIFFKSPKDFGDY